MNENDPPAENPQAEPAKPQAGADAATAPPAPPIEAHAAASVPLEDPPTAPPPQPATAGPVEAVEQPVATPQADAPEVPAPQTETPEPMEPPAEPAPAPPELTPAQLVAARQAANQVVFAESRRHTRRSFVVAAGAAAAGYGVYHWINTSPGIESQPAPFRRAFENNAAIARAITGDRALAPTYKLSEARDLRVNGVYGLKRALVPESWRLQLVGSQAGPTHRRFFQDVTAWEYRYTDASTREDQGHDTKVDPNALTAEKMAPMPMMAQAKAQEDRAARMPRGSEEAGESRSTLAPQTPGLLLTLDDILALPRHELVTQFKCIEGWSQIVHWAGVRMADFMEAYPPQLINGADPKYVYMETPDGDYYTGYDLNVCRHPQTLLVTEMMGAPLTQFHGAPLRLHMPTKYGYKQIKRIGLIAYTSSKPDDYWTKLGYDWYAGL